MGELMAGRAFGGGSDKASFAADGTLSLSGAATAWDDLLQTVTGTRTGVVAPTTGTGFRGDSNFYHVTFLHTQADEVQFEIQMPHRGRAGSDCFPHVHFSPVTTGTGTVKFVLELYAANVAAQFPASPVQHVMTKTWATNQQWYHLIAANATGLAIPTWTLSQVWKCRLYRDNTVGGNYAAAVTLLYFDVHVEIDAFGSAQEYVK
jgi:hypothetical protein